MASNVEKIKIHLLVRKVLGENVGTIQNDGIVVLVDGIKYKAFDCMSDIGDENFTHLKENRKCECDTLIKSFGRNTKKLQNEKIIISCINDEFKSIDDLKFSLSRNTLDGGLEDTEEIPQTILDSAKEILKFKTIDISKIKIKSFEITQKFKNPEDNTFTFFQIGKSTEALVFSMISLILSLQLKIDKELYPDTKVMREVTKSNCDKTTVKRTAGKKRRRNRRRVSSKTFYIQRLARGRGRKKYSYD